MPKKYNPTKPSDHYDSADYQALKLSNLPAALSSEGTRFDSSEDASVFFARELDYIKSETYDVEYPEFTALNNFPISMDVPAGAASITYYSYDKTGIAKIISNYATDLPRADIKGKPTTSPVKSLGASYGYSIQDMRESLMGKKSLDIRRADSARYAIEFAINSIALGGDEGSGLIGILTPDNDIPIYVIPANGQGGSTLWKDKSAQQILADINGMQAYTAKLTKNVEKPDTLMLPSDVFIDITTRQIDNTGLTVGKFVLDNAPYLKHIIPASEFQSDSDINPYATGTDPQSVALLYKNDKKKFSVEIPLMFVQHPAQPVKLEVEVPCEARTGGVILYYPLSLLLALGI